MALEIHIMTTGETHGVPVQDLGTIGAAVAKAWPGSTMGNCDRDSLGPRDGHETCVAVFRQASKASKASAGGVPGCGGVRPANGPHGGE